MRLPDIPMVNSNPIYLEQAMNVNPWDGAERRADGTNRRRVAIIFDPVKWREKVYGAPGSAAAPPDAALSHGDIEAADCDGGTRKHSVCSAF